MIAAVGTGRQATGAGAASIVFRGIRVQFEGGEDLGEKEPVAEKSG